MKNSQLLARVDIPLYMVKVVSERHILVAGGGGHANTGVKNAVEIYELIACPSGSTCTAKLVNRFYTESRAIMSGTVFQDDRHSILAGGGINGECMLWKMRLLVTNHRKDHNYANGSVGSNLRMNANDAANLRRRRTSSSSSVGAGDDPVGDGVHPGAGGVGLRSRTSSISEESRRQSVDSSVENDLGYGFELTKLTAFQTDFSSKEDEPFVKVIRYNNILSVLVTGGADGHIRIWRFPNVTKLIDITAHKDEIDDLDVNPSGTLIVSVSRDGHGYVWNTCDGKRHCELECQMPVIKNSTQLVKYVIRGCRFGLVIDNPAQYKLYTVHNPAVRQKPPKPAYICKWDTTKFTIEKLSSLGPIMVSTMAISDDGRFIGIGTQEGTVEIYIAFSLQRIYSYPKAHNIFVTGLEFLKTCPETQLLTGNNDSSLVSISVDRHIVIHNIPKQRTMGLLSSIIAFVVTIICIYIILDFLGL